MTIRSALAAATVATSLATIAVPALAQPAQTFQASGHALHVPGGHRSVPAEAKASGTPGQAYASGLSGSVANTTAFDRQGPRRINVWGSWLDAPSY